jgi:hypothetical protein
VKPRQVLKLDQILMMEMEGTEVLKCPTHFFDFTRWEEGQRVSVPGKVQDLTGQSNGEI